MYITDKVEAIGQELCRNTGTGVMMGSWVVCDLLDFHKKNLTVSGAGGWNVAWS
jgi:hypothetical protein